MESINLYFNSISSNLTTNIYNPDGNIVEVGKYSSNGKKVYRLMKSFNLQSTSNSMYTVIEAGLEILRLEAHIKKDNYVINLCGYNSSTSYGRVFYNSSNGQLSVSYGNDYKGYDVAIIVEYVE